MMADMSAVDLHASLANKCKLLTISNPKTAKGIDAGYLTGVLHLAPAWESSYNTCPAHTKDCAAACLYFAGRGAMSKIQQARIARTKLFFEDRQTFLSKLDKDINTIFYYGIQANLNTSIRLNGTSDIRWEVYGVPQQYPDIQFYDYTKISNRRNLPSNYHLTFSFSGSNLTNCKEALTNGMNVAVPFIKMPNRWLGHEVIDGDKNDLRFDNGGPYIIGLKAKGRLRKQPTSIFLGDNHVL